MPVGPWNGAATTDKTPLSAARVLADVWRRLQLYEGLRATEAPYHLHTAKQSDAHGAGWLEVGIPRQFCGRERAIGNATCFHSRAMFAMGRGNRAERAQPASAAQEGTEEPTPAVRRHRRRRRAQRGGRFTGRRQGVGNRAPPKAGALRLQRLRRSPRAKPQAESDSATHGRPPACRWRGATPRIGGGRELKR